MINVTLKGGAVKEFEPGVSPADVAKSIGMGLYKSACAARVDGEAVDLAHSFGKGLRAGDPDVRFPGRQARLLAHGRAHYGAGHPAPVPGCQFGIGPALDDGWYYDIGGTEPFTPDQFEAIEAEMKKIVKADLPVEKRFITVEEGREIFKGRPTSWSCWRNTPKRLAAFGLPAGDFTDLCAGPHLMSTGAVKAVKLLEHSQRLLGAATLRGTACAVCTVRHTPRPPNWRPI